MNLVDTSVWVDYLRASDTRARKALRRMLSSDDLPAVTEPVVMELMAGALDERAVEQLDLLTSALPMLSVQPVHDYRDATLIYRATRRRGFTVRRLTDCLIAAVALRHDAVLVHKDADFDAIARAVPLRTTPVR
jgi:predicted nucleic acid-binding protein